jgi:hypothetical protein
MKKVISAVIIFLLISVAAVGVTTNVSASKSSNSITNDQIISDMPGLPTVYMQGQGNHFGHYSFLDKWTMTHREYTNYYDDPNDDLVYQALGYKEEAETVSWTVGVDVNASEITNTEYNENGQLVGFDYKDSNGKPHHVNLDYNEDGNVDSYTDTGPEGWVESFEYIEYDDNGQVTSYTKVYGQTTRIVNIEYDDNYGRMTAFISESTRIGSTTIIDRSEIEYGQYNDMGLISSFNWSIFSGKEKFVTSITNISYNNQGLVYSYVSDAETSAGDVTTTTTRQSTEYYGDNHVSGDRQVSGYTEIAKTFDANQNIILQKITTKHYVYDSKGRMIEYTEVTWSTDSENITTNKLHIFEYNSFGILETGKIMEKSNTDTLTHLLEYNSLGQVEEELIIDQETGNYTDVNDLKKLLDYMSQDELEQWLVNLLNGEIDEYIEVLNKGDETSNRNNRSLLKKHHLEVNNFYQDPDYAEFAGVLRNWTSLKDDNLPGLSQ